MEKSIRSNTAKEIINKINEIKKKTGKITKKKYLIKERNETRGQTQTAMWKIKANFRC